MPLRLLRLAYACEFLIAIVAIFTAWSEIGTQDALDLMHWAWKLGFSLALAAAIVAFSAALISEDAIWTLRSARWLTAIVVLLLGMGVVTYFYSMQVETSTESDETTSSALHLPMGAPLTAS